MFQCIPETRWNEKIATTGLLYWSACGDCDTGVIDAGCKSVSDIFSEDPFDCTGVTRINRVRDLPGIREAWKHYQFLHSLVSPVLEALQKKTSSVVFHLAPSQSTNRHRQYWVLLAHLEAITLGDCQYRNSLVSCKMSLERRSNR